MKPIIPLLTIFVFLAGLRAVVGAPGDSLVEYRVYVYGDRDGTQKTLIGGESNEWKAVSIKEALAQVGYGTPEKQRDFLDQLQAALPKEELGYYSNLDSQDFGGVWHYVVEDEKGNQVLAILKWPEIEDWDKKYAIFAKEGKGWALWTFILSYNKYEGVVPPRQPRVFNMDGELFISVPASEGGTGVGRFWRDFYRLTDEGAEPSVGIPVEGHWNGLGKPYHIEFKAEPIAAKSDARGCYFETALTVDFSAGEVGDGQDSPRDMELFSKKYYLRYSRGGEEGEPIALDAQHSDLKGDTVDPLDLWASPDKFIDFFQEDLRAIALGKDPDKKAWLKRLLKDDDAQKAKKRGELLKLLR